VSRLPAFALALLLAGRSASGLCASPDAGARASRLVYLFFADGVTPIPRHETCQGVRVPPLWRCDFPGAASAKACQREILAHLGRWYQGLNVAFTTTEPDAWDDTVVVTSDGSWCAAPPGLRGDAPLLCQPKPGQTAFVYDCVGASEHCGGLIAHEQGHLLGLEHVVSPTDLMSASWCAPCVGFEDRANVVLQPSACGRSVQNSHRWVMEQTGAPGVAEAGCAMAGARPPALLPLALSALGLRARRRRSRQTSHG
jgi:hypothetical protein